MKNLKTDTEEIEYQNGVITNICICKIKGLSLNFFC